MDTISKSAADIDASVEHSSNDGLCQIIRLLARQAAIEHRRLHHVDSPTLRTSSPRD